jgi:hypothetical protein
MNQFSKAVIYSILAMLIAVMVWSADKKIKAVRLAADKSEVSTPPAYKIPAVQSNTAPGGNAKPSDPEFGAGTSAPAPSLAPAVLTQISVTSPAAVSSTNQPALPDRSEIFMDSPIARKWMTEEGVTAVDIQNALNRVRAQGYPERMMADPGIVRQFLPRRNIVSVNVDSFDIADHAPAGQPVPFQLNGALPDPSFQFTRFEITRKEDVIRIRPLGNTSGAVVPGVEVPVKLEGALDPLPPGTYRIDFSGSGPEGYHHLVIE